MSDNKHRLIGKVEANSIEQLLISIAEWLIDNQELSCEQKISLATNTLCEQFYQY